MSTKITSTTGRFTLPAQTGMDKEVIELINKWGADAIRDSDGTILSNAITSLGYDVYSTLCLIRADQTWNKAHADHCQQKFIMSEPRIAKNNTLGIDIMKGYSKEQFKPDTIHDIHKYWEVINRTTSEIIPSGQWSYNAITGMLTINNAIVGNAYTVNVLVYQIWETTSMYNHITNNWTGEHQLGIDPRQPETYDHLLNYLDSWMENHADTNWVRFTSLAYQFPIITNENRQTRYQDWAGYLDPVSALALDDFEKEYGYRLRGEHLVDNGYYNSTNRVPSIQYRDWIEFVNKFVNKFAKECVSRVHKANKKAVLFFCDHWIGTEPYLPNFQEIGFDGIIGPCINGRELRRVGDVPGNLTKELRLYPYFFPVDLMNNPSFMEGGNPLADCKRFWMDIRRALLRKPIDRIGFGGYLDLAVKYPEFIDYVAHLSNEFREICDNSGQTKFQGPSFKVGILTSWGKMRSWIWDQSWPNGGIMEALSGMPIELEFMSFDEIKQNGIPSDIGVILNIGEGESSWSGGINWIDPEIITVIRTYVANGGGFIGVIEPTAYQSQGNYFQLSDILGVQREIGKSRDCRKLIHPEITKEHFITEDQTNDINLGYVIDNIYLVDEDINLLAKKENTIILTANQIDKGRSVYFNGFLLEPENIRLLLRSIYWSASKEDELYNWHSSNINTDIAAYPSTNKVVVLNNSDLPQTTNLYVNKTKFIPISLAPNESIWFNCNNL